jgi:hypothetical protein
MLLLLPVLLLLLPQDYNQALRYFRKAAEKNNGLGLYGLGYMYLSGTAVLQDYDTALKKLQAAADAGDRDAHFYLGTMYYNVSIGGAAVWGRWSEVLDCGCDCLDWCKKYCRCERGAVGQVFIPSLLLPGHRQVSAPSGSDCIRWHLQQHGMHHNRGLHSACGIDSSVL